MANSNPPAHRNGAVPQLSDDTVRELLAVQKQELALRLKEVERDNAEINLNKSVAQQSIEAQERDRKHEREEITKRQKTHQNFILIAVVVALIFAGYAIYAKQSTLVLDVVKVIIGFVGGMGYSAIRKRRRASADED